MGEGLGEADVRAGLVQGVETAWEQRWPACPPVAHWLPACYPDRWVRFHSLPGSKRYAVDEAEYSVVLERHNTVIGELDPGVTLTVITFEWSVSEEPPEKRSALLSRLDPGGVHWRTVLEEPGEDPEDRVFSHLFVSRRSWRPGVIDDLLRAVADDELSHVILGPADLCWLYHPYDGGADVILPSRLQRDELRGRHRGWLSSHPAGL